MWCQRVPDLRRLSCLTSLDDDGLEVGDRNGHGADSEGEGEDDAGEDHVVALGLLSALPLRLESGW